MNVADQLRKSPSLSLPSSISTIKSSTSSSSSSSSSSSLSSSSLPSPPQSSSSSSPSSTSPSSSKDIRAKPKPNTFFYDSVDLAVEDKQAYDPSWIPLWTSFDKNPNIHVYWKGSSLCIASLPYIEALHPNEKNIASTLRLTPEQYLKCKRALILNAQIFYQRGLVFRKSDAQKVCRIDVNKTSCLWGAFNRLGWFHPR
ncbi:Homeodomain-like protein [Absidia repens]|uniref:Homeodomain-like protein n=1 Tax=Absidia repens TaxID=90262 RepID=A0A1X2IM19_9FUNG|nr:Homeodomain-like protein [Absidia repens]